MVSRNQYYYLRWPRRGRHWTTLTPDEREKETGRKIITITRREGRRTNRIHFARHFRLNCNPETARHVPNYLRPPLAKIIVVGSFIPLTSPLLIHEVSIIRRTACRLFFFSPNIDTVLTNCVFCWRIAIT